MQAVKGWAAMCCNWRYLYYQNPCVKRKGKRTKVWSACSLIYIIVVGERRFWMCCGGACVARVTIWE